MKVFILDVYQNRNFRVSKDTNGGYGTGNEFGDGLFASFLTRIKKKTTDFPPLAVAYIAACLKYQGHKVMYGRNCYPPKDTDFVLLPSSIVEHTEELKWGKRLKKDGFHIGYTGPFAGILSEAYLKAGDFVVKGEPEFFFLKSFSKNILKGEVGLDTLSSNLDELPFPDWSRFDTSHLKYHLFGGGGRFFPMLASRGCPYSCCYYCTYPVQQGRVNRFRSSKNIVDEMEYLKNKYNATTILFRDPIFTVNRERTMGFLEELIKRNLKMKFIIETRLDTFDDGLIHAFQRAGLITVKVGIEAANQDILEKLHRKDTKKDFQFDMIRKLEQAGISVICFYILGLPDDTLESCFSTIRYAIKLNTAGAQFSICTPYPGTKFYEDIKDKILVDRFDEFNQFNLVYKHDRLTREQIEKLKNIAYTRYYLRLSWFVKYTRMKFLQSVL